MCEIYVAKAFGIQGIDTIRLGSLPDATASVIAGFVGDCLSKSIALSPG